MDAMIKLITGELAGEQAAQIYFQRMKLDKASKKSLKEQKKDKTINTSKREWVQYSSTWLFINAFLKPCAEILTLFSVSLFFVSS